MTERLALNQLMNERESNKIIDRMDEYQRAAFDAMLRGPVKQVYMDIPAGYGKTLVAFTAALTLLRAGKVKKVYYIRFPSERGGKLGFLPGELATKESIYYLPAYDALHKNGLQDEAIEALRASETFVFMTDITLRGATLEDAFVIVDEAQNGQDLSEVELVLTRFTDSIRAAVIGDSRQVDSNVSRYGTYDLNAFQVFTRHMTKEPWAKQFPLHVNYRGKMAKHAAAVDLTLRELEAGTDGLSL